MIAGSTALGGCAHPSPLGGEIDAACGGPQWREKGGMNATITVVSAHAPVFTGTLLYQASTRRMVIQRLTDGVLEQAGYSDGQIWTRQIPSDSTGAWTPAMLYASYLPAVFELRDSQTVVRELAPMTLNGVKYRVGLITRPSLSVGRVKWAVCLDRDDTVPKAIIPLAPPQAPAGNSRASSVPSLTRGFAVTYEEFSNVESVLVPTRWTVWNWDSRHGVTGAPVATVSLTFAAFGNPDPSGFADVRSNHVDDLSGCWWW